jgi:beta-lactamase regulating signal transducer with metallopeptidase domain
MIADILHALAKANLAAGLAVALILPTRLVLRRWFGAQVAYGLWLAVPLAMAGAFLPARKIIIPIRHGPVSAQLMAPVSAPADYSPLLLGLWIGGIALSLAILVERQRRFRASLGPLSGENGGILRAERQGGPAVVGFFSPRIVLPADFEVRFSAAEREAVLAHECGHLRAGHLQTNVLVAMVQCLCWFNPLAYLGSRALRADQELACDAAALSRSAIGSRQYGEVLLRAQLNAPPLPFGCSWPPNGARALKERLIMLKTPLPDRRLRLAGAALITLATAASAAIAWAAQPPQRFIDPVQAEAEARAYARDFLKTRLETGTDPAERQDLLDRLSSIPDPGLISQEPAAEQKKPVLLTQAAQPKPGSAPQVSVSNSVIRDYDPAKDAPKPVMVTAPDWTARPDGAAMLATAQAILGTNTVPEGQARMSCTVAGDGSLNGCNLLNQTSDDVGKLAMALSPNFKMQPGLDKNGAAIDGAKVVIPFLFKNN